MGSRTFATVAATIFALVSFGHLLRIVCSWPFVFGGCDLPMWVSWVGTFVAGGLSVWGFASVSRGR
ncbi:hypothetical protein KKG45_02960 [bacterium]|nr:hypothetical protein [bacterium]MBU1072184.1 hypothetical protein [bacterium]